LLKKYSHTLHNATVVTALHLGPTVRGLTFPVPGWNNQIRGADCRSKGGFRQLN